MSTKRTIINVTSDGVINTTAYVAKVTYDGILTPFRVIVDGNTIPTNYSTLLSDVTKNRRTYMVESSLDGVVWEMNENISCSTTSLQEVIL